MKTTSLVSRGAAVRRPPLRFVLWAGLLAAAAIGCLFAWPVTASVTSGARGAANSTQDDEDDAALLYAQWKRAYRLRESSIEPPATISLPPGVPRAPHLEACSARTAARQALERRGPRGESPAWARERLPQPPWVRAGAGGCGGGSSASNRLLVRLRASLLHLARPSHSSLVFNCSFPNFPASSSLPTPFPPPPPYPLTGARVGGGQSGRHAGGAEGPVGAPVPAAPVPRPPPAARAVAGHDVARAGLAAPRHRCAPAPPRPAFVPSFACAPLPPSHVLHSLRSNPVPPHPVRAMLSVAVLFNRTLVIVPGSFPQADHSECQGAEERGSLDCYFLPFASIHCRKIAMRAYNEYKAKRGLVGSMPMEWFEVEVEGRSPWSPWIAMQRRRFSAARATALAASAGGGQGGIESAVGSADGGSKEDGGAGEDEWEAESGEVRWCGYDTKRTLESDAVVVFGCSPVLPHWAGGRYLRRLGGAAAQYAPPPPLLLVHVCMCEYPPSPPPPPHSSIHSAPWERTGTNEVIGELVRSNTTVLKVQWWRAQALRFMLRWPLPYLCHLLNRHRHRAFGMHVARSTAAATRRQQHVLSMAAQLASSLGGEDLRGHLLAEAVGAWAGGVGQADASQLVLPVAEPGSTAAALQARSLLLSSQQPADGGGDGGGGVGGEVYMPRAMVSVHVRQGDKAFEMRLFSFPSFVFLANRLRRLDPALHNVWLSTEMQVR
ncbi:unnamed protein product [Closterium sp. Naga37s-1]|nr:unnamed protein product [Closterium sp. Naga37s-1]